MALDFNYFAPRNLFKAFEIARALGLKKKANAYLHAIERYYPVYAELKAIQKYLNPKIDFEPIVINRRYAKISDYENVEMGVINGEIIGFNRFMEALDKARSDLATQSENRIPVLTEETFWPQFVQTEVLNNAYEAMYISTDENEVYDFILGQNGYPVQQDLANAFRNPETGEFDRDMLKVQIENLKGSSDVAIQDIWKRSLEYYTTICKQFKYNAIIEQGSYITNLSAENALHEQMDHYEISYDAEPLWNYSDFPLSTKEVKTYFQKHQYDNHYRQSKELKKFQFIYVPLIPSSEDSMQFYSELESLKTRFSESLNDSMFVVQNSEEPVFTTKMAYTPDSDSKGMLKYPAHMDAAFRAAKKGDILGPYIDGDFQCLAKVIEKGPLMTVRHILITAPKHDPQAVADAKEKTLRIMERLNSENFAEMVKKYSDDTGSLDNGGVYSDFPEGMMIPEFNDFARDEPLNKIGYVQSNFGFHIMEVIDRKENAACKLAIVKKTLKPSNNSNQKSEEFAKKILKDFKSELENLSDPITRNAHVKNLAEERGLTTQELVLTVNNPDFQSLEIEDAQDSIMDFCLRPTLKENDLIEAPIFSDGQYIIPIYTAHNPAGTSSLAFSYTIVKWRCQNDLKAQKIIAKSTSKTFEKSIKVTLANPRIEGSPAHEIVAEISRSEEGEILKPMHNNAHVIWVKVNKKTIADITEKDIAEIKLQMTATEKSLLNFLIMEASTERAGVINNVQRFLLDLWK